MRGVKAKACRRLAEHVTTGAPSREYVKNPKTGQIRLHPECTRAVYQRVKKQYKEAHY